MLTRNLLSVSTIFVATLSLFTHSALGAQPLTLSDLADQADTALKKEKRAERGITAKCVKAKKQVDAFNQALASKNSSVASWLSQIADINTQLDPKQQKMSDLQSDKSQKQGEITGLQAQKTNAMSNYNQYINRQTALKNDLEKQIATKETEVDAAADAQIVAARPIPTDTTYDIYLSRQSVAFNVWRARQNELDALNGQLDQVNGTLNSPPPSSADIDSQIGTKQNELNIIVGDINYLQGQINSLQSTVNDLNAKIFASRASIGNLMPKSVPLVCTALNPR